MPLYDYACPECGQVQEVLLESWKDQGPPCGTKDCPGVPLRQAGTFSARFRGAGFHVNDYPTAKRVKDAEREGVVRYTPEDQHNLKRRGLW